MRSEPLPPYPQRLVSLVPSTTETVAVLGAAERLVACTRYCTEPSAQLAGVSRIGGTKNPDRDAIMALLPDLVLANAEENRAEDLEWLSARVPVLVQTPRTVAEAAVCLRELAEQLDLAAAADGVSQRLRRQVAVARAEASARPPCSVYYAIWRKPWMTVAGDTFVHDVLRLVGAHNVAAGESTRYPELSPAEAVARGVELVLLASEPWQFDCEQRAEIEQAQLFAKARIVLCDGRDFSWHGVRMADGLGRCLDLMRRLQPGPG